MEATDYEVRRYSSRHWQLLAALTTRRIPDAWPVMEIICGGIRGEPPETQLGIGGLASSRPVSAPPSRVPRPTRWICSHSPASAAAGAEGVFWKVTMGRVCSGGVQGGAMLITRPLRVSAQGLKVDVGFRGPVEGVAVCLLGWPRGAWNQPRLFLSFRRGCRARGV